MEDFSDHKCAGDIPRLEALDEQHMIVGPKVHVACGVNTEHTILLLVMKPLGKHEEKEYLILPVNFCPFCGRKSPKQTMATAPSPLDN